MSRSFLYKKVKMGKYSKKEKYMFIEIIKFFIYSLLIVLISKYILVKLLRKLAESLNLTAKAVGNIAGIATSVPELLTVSFSAIAGLVGTSIYNIISSNVINFLQYSFSIYISKNQKSIRNKAIRIDLILVIVTILLPILMLIAKIEFSISIVPIFILLFLLFYFINYNAHKLYLKKQEDKIKEKIENEKKWVKGKIKIIIQYSFYLLFTSIALYIIGNALSSCLENLANYFKIPEIILGIALGFITSLPELITFFEAQKHHEKKQKEELGVIEATNNLLTSNILNLFVIQSIGIIIYSIFY